jgi:hypothetical protein
MTDGTILPCIVVESAALRVDLALRRFEQMKKSPEKYMGYREIVTVFVAKGNSVNDYALQELSVSPHAIPLAHLRQVGGETSMAWTEFYVNMRDGTEFRFGTTFSAEFFDMPEGYSAADVAKIVPAVPGAAPRQDRIYREKPFFTCYVHGL